MTIGQLARHAGVRVDTVRHYERIGLMPQPVRTAAGYRQYGPADLQRLRFIRQAKRLGFTLPDIARLLALVQSSADRREVREMAADRLAGIEQALAETTRLRDTLATLVDACRGSGPTADCPIVAAVLDIDNAHDTHTPDEETHE